MDNKNSAIADFSVAKNKKSIIYFDGPRLIKVDNRILIVPFCDHGLSITDIKEIENELLDFAFENKIAAKEDNCIHIIKSIKKYVYHGFAIL